MHVLGVSDVAHVDVRGIMKRACRECVALSYVLHQQTSACCRNLCMPPAQDFVKYLLEGDASLLFIRQEALLDGCRVGLFCGGGACRIVFDANRALFGHCAAPDTAPRCRRNWPVRTSMAVGKRERESDYVNLP